MEQLSLPLEGTLTLSRDKLKIGKYTRWASQLTEDQLLSYLWCLGEYLVRDPSPLPHQSNYPGDIRMINAHNMLLTLHRPFRTKRKKLGLKETQSELIKQLEQAVQEQKDYSSDTMNMFPGLTEKDHKEVYEYAMERSKEIKEGRDDIKLPSSEELYKKGKEMSAKLRNKIPPPPQSSGITILKENGASKLKKNAVISYQPPRDLKVTI